jgi:hypothetical protein
MASTSDVFKTSLVRPKQVEKGSTPLPQSQKRALYGVELTWRKKRDRDAFIEEVLGLDPAKVPSWDVMP